MDISRISINDLVPHSGKMSLLDRLIEADHQHAIAELTIHSKSMFFTPGKGVPVWVGIEYMAQTIAAFSGYDAIQKKEPVKIGLLVGCRKSICHVSWFAEHTTLQVIVEYVWESEGMAIFDCAIRDAGGRIMMEGKINVYQPENIDDYLKGKHV